MNNRVIRRMPNLAIVGLILFVIQTGNLAAQSAISPDAEADAGLTIKELMNAVITPMTSTIWGAYQLQTDAEWQEVENAALTVIAAGQVMALGGSAEEDKVAAQETEWQQYNNAMMSAARAVIAAVAARDEEALFNAGNDQLYPPCESCHQRYQMTQ